MEIQIKPIVYEIKTSSHIYTARYKDCNKGWILYRGEGVDQKVFTFDGWHLVRTNYMLAQVFKNIEDIKEYIERH